MEDKQSKPRIVPGGEIGTDTAQTTNLHRFVAVSPERMEMQGPARIFFGRAFTPAHATSGPHHHGEAETAGYVLSGRCRIYYGEGYREYVEAGPGDFMYVPPHIPHIEVNEQDEPFIGIFARSPENIVVNLDEGESPPPR